jgi:hypothetical protein
LARASADQEEAPHLGRAGDDSRRDRSSRRRRDIRVSATFYPPDKRTDRVNMPTRLKPYWDGIADALKVNDRRFLPSYHFAEPVKNPRVVVSIG